MITILLIYSLLQSQLPVVIGQIVDNTPNNAVNNYKPKGNLSCIHFNNDLFMTFFNSSRDIEEYMSRSSEVTCYWKKSNGNVEPELRQFSEVKRIEIKNSTLMKIPQKIFSNFSQCMIFKAREAKIQEIHPNDFTSGDFVYYLDLARNEIKTLEGRIFSNLKGIKEIDLSSNKLEMIQDEAFDGFGVNFTRIDLSGNKIKFFKEDYLIAMIYNSSRKWLPFDVNLRKNEIETIEPSKKNPVSVPEVNIQLSGNKIKKLELLKIEIFELNLKNSSLESVNVNASYVSLENNKLKSYRIKGKTRTLNLQNNLISNITYDDYLTVPRVMNLAGNNLSSDAIYDLLKKVTFLEILDISQNPLKSVKVDMFSELLMLQRLIMSNASLSVIPFGLFAYQVNLKVLDLSYNNLSNIDLHVFSSNVNLEVLDLSGTNFSQINDCKKFGEILPKLKLLGLGNNNWKCDVLSKLKTCLNSQFIKLLIPDRPVKNESNIMGVKCQYTQNEPPLSSTTAQGLFPNEIMDKIKELDEKIFVTKQATTTQGITSLELLLSILLSAAVTVFVIYGVNKLKNRIQMSRIRMPNFSRRDSPDTIVTYDGRTI